MNNDWNFKSFVDILIASRKTIRDNVSRSRPKIAERLFYLILPSSVCGNDEKAAQKYVAAGEKPPLEITDDHSAEARSIYGLSDDEITEQYITSNEFDEIFDFFIPEIYAYLIHKCITVLEDYNPEDLNSNLTKLVRESETNPNNKLFLFHCLIDVLAFRINKGSRGISDDFLRENRIIEERKALGIPEKINGQRSTSDELLKSKNTNIEFLTKNPRLIVEQYKQRSLDEWDTLQQELADSNGKVFIQGLSGIGKSEFAKEFWNKAKESGEFKYFAWIDFENDLESSLFRQFYPAMNEDGTPKITQSILLKRVQDMGTQLLLIIDNFSSKEGFEKDSLLSDLLAFNCTVLITTTEFLDYTGLKRHKLESLSLDNCISLFKDYYSAEYDDEKISTIIQLLGFHTISIELVSKSCNEERVLLNNIISFLSENNLAYSDVEISTNHPRLTTNETVKDQLVKLFSIMQKYLHKEEISILIGFSIFKKASFTREQAMDWFDLKSMKYLEKMVKLGWLKSEKFPERDQNIYSIHDACALLVLNQFDITVYYQHFSHIVESDIYWKEIRSTSVINEDFVLRITSFIESFLYIEKSFNFIFLINDYAYKLYYMTSKHYNFYKERCKVYIQQAKSILKQMNAGDFEKCKDSSYLINDEPDTFDSLNYQIEISLDIIMIFLLSTEKSKNSFMKQESLYQELLTKHPLINKEKLVYQFDYINISQELLWLYCDYEQKEKILPCIQKLTELQENFSYSHIQNDIVYKNYAELDLLCFTNIARGYIIIKNYTSAEEYLEKSRKMLNFLKKLKTDDTRYVSIENYKYLKHMLLVCKNRGVDAYKQSLCDKYHFIKKSTMDEFAKKRILEGILFAYNPFYLDKEQDKKVP